MVSLLLATDEVVELTGTTRRKDQLHWLRSHGIPAEVGVDRKVKVLRAAVDARMMPGAKGRQATKTEPRLDLLRKAS